MSYDLECCVQGQCERLSHARTRSFSVKKLLHFADICGLKSDFIFFDEKPTESYKETHCIEKAHQKMFRNENYESRFHNQG